MLRLVSSRVNNRIVMTKQEYHTASQDIVSALRPKKEEASPKNDGEQIDHETGTHRTGWFLSPSFSLCLSL